MIEFPYYYAWSLKSLWGAHGSPLYKQRCRVIARALGGKNARLIEFQDGVQHIVSGNALRKWRTA